MGGLTQCHSTEVDPPVLNGSGMRLEKSTLRILRLLGNRFAAEVFLQGRGDGDGAVGVLILF